MTLLSDTWASVLSEGHKLHEELLNLRELLDKDLENLLARPNIIRPVFATLRRHKPILVAPRIAIVALYDDVREVLGNEAAFSVAPIYGPKMEATTGDFVLGMDDTPQYEREIGLMRQATKPEDLNRIKDFTNNTAAQLIESHADGHLDAVEDLSRLVPTRLLGSYFGTPGPDDATTMRWMRTIFREIFLNLGNDPNMAKEASDNANALNTYLDGVVAQRKAEIAAGQETPDDFVTRLVRLQAASPDTIADEVIRRCVGGTIVGTVDTNSKAIVQAIDQLLDRPLTLGEAAQAAAADDDARVTQYVFEALRFNPQNPILLRRCMVTTTIAAGSTRAATISAGSLVVVGTESAMFDPAKFPEPDAFRSDRPIEDYIHFGSGMHTCFGKHIGTVLIPAVVKQLLKKTGLRRADGDAGKLAYDGAFPNNLGVAFDPA